MQKYNIIIIGGYFDYLLVSVYAADRKEAMRLARKEVLPGEEYGKRWVLKQARSN